MYRLAANLEWLFTEAGPDPADRVRAAAAQGLDAVEIWGWRDKNIDTFADALGETGTDLLSLIVDPQLALTNPTVHDDYLQGVQDSLAIAQRLGSPHLVVVAGLNAPDRSWEDQHTAVVDVLRRAACILEGTAVTLLLEPLNSRVDHIGTFLDRTADGLDIVREVDRPELRLLFDAYHALVMDEDIAAELDGAIDLIGHVQIADVPGRHQPGTGKIDWSDQLRTLARLGYRGAIGLEYQPTGSTDASLTVIEQIARSIDLASDATAPEVRA